MNATSQQLLEKWSPVLDFDGLDPIKDPHRRAVTAFLLENQERAIYEQSVAESGSFGLLSEAVPNSHTGSNDAGTISGFTSTGVASDGTVAGRAGYDPILISMVRRSAPQMIAFDVCGVQPMSGPSGLVFYMKSNYVAPSTSPDSHLQTPEALFDEADTLHSSTHDGGADPAATVKDPFDTSAYAADTVGAMTTAKAEQLGGATGEHFREMSFSIDSTTVTAKSRALKAEFTVELAQDLKAIHGLDAETELANILSTEILSEINREIIRTINSEAVIGAQENTANAGIYDMSTDTNGRWSVEKFKGLHFQLEREANAIALATRRGRGNWIIASADIVAALAMTGTLDTGIDKGGIATGQLSPDGIVGNTFVGTLNGRYKVYVDPYFVSADPSATAGTDTSRQYATVGYKGTSPYDAGLFYCPYVPLAMMKAVGEDTFQPKIGFKTRYGILGNPFVGNPAGAGNNIYFRKLDIRNIM